MEIVGHQETETGSSVLFSLCFLLDMGSKMLPILLELCRTPAAPVVMSLFGDAAHSAKGQT